MVFQGVHVFWFFRSSYYFLLMIVLFWRCSDAELYWVVYVPFSGSSTLFVRPDLSIYMRALLRCPLVLFNDDYEVTCAPSSYIGGL